MKRVLANMTYDSLHAAGFCCLIIYYYICVCIFKPNNHFLTICCMLLVIKHVEKHHFKKLLFIKKINQPQSHKAKSCPFLLHHSELPNSVDIFGFVYRSSKWRRHNDLCDIMRLTFALTCLLLLWQPEFSLQQRTRNCK